MPIENNENGSTQQVVARMAPTAVAPTTRLSFFIEKCVLANNDVMIVPIVTMGSSMKIGELAKSVNCHVETVRYYEKEGMLSEPPRSENGYRIYTQQHLRQLRLIRRAKDLGFSQDQVKSLIRLAYDVDNPCDDVHELTVSQIANVNDKINELNRLKSALVSMQKACEAGNHKSCPSLDILFCD